MSIPSQILSWLAVFAQRVIEAGGYPGLGIFLITASLNIPIPSEIAYAFSGFLSYWGSFRLPWVIAVGVFGNVLGASLNYWIGAWRKKNHNPQARFLLIPAESIERAEKWFSRWGSWGVFFGHLTPGLRAFIGFPAGFFGIKFGKFFILTVVATLLWATFWASLGYQLGVEWGRVSIWARKLDVLILVLIAIGGIWWVKKYLLPKKA